MLWEEYIHFNFSLVHMVQSYKASLAHLAVLLRKFLPSKKEQEICHKLYTRYFIFAGDLFTVAPYMLAYYYNFFKLPYNIPPHKLFNPVDIVFPTEVSNVWLNNIVSWSVIITEDYLGYI